MDINCTYGCIHQKEGKCCLTEVPTGQRFLNSMLNGGDFPDCAYFEDKNKGNTTGVHS